MRYSQAEKMEIIRTVEASELSVRKTLIELDVPSSNFYSWYRSYLGYGYDGLADHRPGPRRFWNRIPDCEKEKVVHRPRLLSDNGPCYLSSELNDYLDDRGIDHTRGAPYHPQTQGKIERYHRTMKNVVKLQNYYFPGELESEIGKFVHYYNNEKYHKLFFRTIII